MEQKIWWYSVNNDQKGPVSEQELNVLANQNFITPHTPIWKEGLESWINFSDMNAPVDNSPKRPPLPGGVSQPAAHAGPPAGGHTPNMPGAPTGQGYTQPHAAQPNFNTHANTGQANRPPGNFNTQSHTASPEALNYITDFYYRAEFERIMNSNESYKGKFNWWAFFFSWIWCFTKGLWQLALLILVVAFATKYFLPYSASGVLGLGIAIFCGMRGTFMYYTAKMKNKQLF